MIMMIFYINFIEVLPVVEFILEDGIRYMVHTCTWRHIYSAVDDLYAFDMCSDEEAMKLILKEPPRKNSKDQWKETQSGSILI